MNAIAQLWDDFQAWLGILITLLVVFAVGSVIWSLGDTKQPYKCYSEGKIVAEGVTTWNGNKPEWHGEGYTKLPNGRVIKGVCRW